MHVCGQHFSKSVLGRIQETVDSEPSLSQLELSRRVCQWLNWRSPNGRLQDMSCRKALAKLHRRGIVNLPRQEKTYSFKHAKSVALKPDVAEVQCGLQQLG